MCTTRDLVVALFKSCIKAWNYQRRSCYWGWSGRRILHYWRACRLLLLTKKAKRACNQEILL